MFVAMLGYPMPAIVTAWVTVFGRLAFAIGYGAGGPKWRLPGALLGDCGILALVIISIMSVFKWFPIAAEG